MATPRAALPLRRSPPASQRATRGARYHFEVREPPIEATPGGISASEDPWLRAALERAIPLVRRARTSSRLLGAGSAAS
jgi:hypothetical protein